MTLRKRFKMNIQLHSGGLWGPSGPPEGMVNPLTVESNTEVNTGAEVEVPEGGNTNAPEGKKEALEGQIETSPTNTPSNEPKEEFNIRDYLSNFTNEINQKLETLKPKEEAPPQNLGPTEEEIQRMNDEFYNNFMEKPLNSLDERIQNKALEIVKPYLDYVEGIKARETWANKIQQFEANHPDFKENVSDIAKLIQERPDIRNTSDPLETAYKLVKADKLEAKVKSIKPFEEMIKDPENFNKLLENPEIKNAILKQVMEGKKGQAPNLIGSNGGEISPTPTEKPKSIKDGTKAWLSNFK